MPLKADLRTQKITMMLTTPNHILTLENDNASALSINCGLYLNKFLYFVLTHKLGTRINNSEKFLLHSTEKKNVKRKCYFSTWTFN